ncbi:MAG TPA: FMN-binding protein [Ruminiclostridium sp.]
MKKISAVILIIALTLSLVACTTTGEPGTSTVTPTSIELLPSTATASPSMATTSASAYKDGTYDEKGDAWDKGQEEANIVITDGKISAVTLKRLEKTGKEVDYTKYDGTEFPNLKEFKVAMANDIIAKQSADVETISGATISTTNWKVAAQRALDKAK